VILVVLKCGVPCPQQSVKWLARLFSLIKWGLQNFLVGGGIDVRPHPHIGLSTVTYLFDGEIIHKDSLGSDLPIKPGALNWMTAGKGIVHSERTSEQAKALGPKLFGIQSWVALPKTHEESDPGFVHYAEKDLPIIRDHGAEVRVITGTMLGAKAPVETAWETLYADVQLQAGAQMPFDADYEERGIYTVSGTIEIAGDTFEPMQLLVFKPGDRITVKATKDSRFMILGGAPMDGPRYIWWNFVSSSKERIELAKEEWRKGRFETVPGDEEEFIPLPE
jgi:redox-sensitive bicupin YhaK (pirin superfamily)